jgi:hypothetical protein
MSETRPPTAGEQMLLELSRAAENLRDTDNELLHAIGCVLKAYVKSYETELGIPECPHHNEDCGGHRLQTYHRHCSATMQSCLCIQPYLNLARWATA